MMDGPAAKKLPPHMKMSRLCTPWLWRDFQSIASRVSICFGAVHFQSILTNILGMSKVLPGRVPQMLTDDKKSTWLDISRYLLSCFEDDPSD